MVQFSGGGEFANEFAFPGKKNLVHLECESREEERAKKP